MFRGVFRALTNIYDRVYYENSWRLLVVNYFCNKKCMKRSLTLSWRRSLSCRNQSAYCFANHWTDFYMIGIGTSVMEELIHLWCSPSVWSFLVLYQLTFTCSKSTTKTLEKTAKYVFSKLLIKTPERRHRHCCGLFIVNFEHISHFFLVFLLFTLNTYMLTGLLLQ